jgi:hypothetical protein
MTNKRVIPKLKRLFYIVYLTTAKAANENPKVGLNNPKVAMDFTCIGGPQPASPSGLWHLYTLALRIRTLGHTKLRVRVGPTLLGRGAAKGPRFLLAPATTGRPPGK